MEDDAEWEAYWALRNPLTVHLTHSIEERNRRSRIWQELYQIWTKWLFEPATRTNLRYWIKRMENGLAYFDKTVYTHMILNSSPIFLNSQEEQDYYWYKFTIRRMKKQLAKLAV
jgi:hypothetical protein